MSQSAEILSMIPDLVLAVHRETLQIMAVSRDALGWPRSELAGKSVHEILPGISQHALDVGSLETSCRHRDGRAVRVEIRGARVTRSGAQQYVLVVREVPERALAEEELKKLNALFDAVLENVEEAIVVKDASGAVERANRAGAEDPDMADAREVPILDEDGRRKFVVLIAARSGNPQQPGDSGGRKRTNKHRPKRRK